MKSNNRDLIREPHTHSSAKCVYPSEQILGISLHCSCKFYAISICEYMVILNIVVHIMLIPFTMLLIIELLRSAKIATAVTVVFSILCY